MREERLADVKEFTCSRDRRDNKEEGDDRNPRFVVAVLSYPTTKQTKPNGNELNTTKGMESLTDDIYYNAYLL